MTSFQVVLSNEPCADLDSFLGDRIYEFNSTITGVSDGNVFNAAIEDKTGERIAAVSGHTWGGCCEICYIWVHQLHRRVGKGMALIQAVEQESIRRSCSQIIVFTHSFQAPLFYEKQGFQKLYRAWIP